MKKLLVALMLIFAVVLSACGAVGNTDTASAEVGSEAEVSLITLHSEATYDLVTADTREFLEEEYDTTDYTYTAKYKYEVSNTPESVKLKWEYADEGIENPVLLISENGDMSSPTEYILTGRQKTFSVGNLYTGKKYYWRVKAMSKENEICSEIGSFETASGPRLLTVSGVANVRDIGGWETASGKTVKEGLAYRGGKLEEITEHGIETMTKELGIKTELDLRAPNEVEVDGEPRRVSLLGENVKYINYSSSAYKDYVKAKNTVPIMKTFADYGNYPIYFHCAGGADRTGCLAFMLGALLGADRNSLDHDYELTATRDRCNFKNTEFDYTSLIMTFEKLEGETDKEKAYNFYRSNGMTAQELSNIYNIMLTDSAVFESGSLACQTVTSGGTVMLDVNFRNGCTVKTVTLGGKEVPFTFDDGSVTVTVDGEKGINGGEIALSDGETLKFDLIIG